MKADAKTVSKVRTTHFSKFLLTDAIHIITYSDLTLASLEPAIYAKDFQALGLLPTNIEGIKVESLGLSLRSIWIRLLFNPKEDLCLRINSHLQNLHSRYMIGMQIRLGGNYANFHEKTMMSSKGLMNAIRIVKEHMQQKGLTEDDVFIFISSDSDMAVNTVREKFGSKCVYSADEFHIYHSAHATMKGNKKRWLEGIKRGITDMMILKDSDFLVYSVKSSYGKFAHELQHSRLIPVQVLPFLQRHGLKCSVYHYNRTEFSSTYV